MDTQKARVFLMNYLNSPAEQSDAWLAAQTPERVSATINMFLDGLEGTKAEDRMSRNLIDMLHTAQLDGRITVAQLAWFRREIVSGNK